MKSPKSQSWVANPPQHTPAYTHTHITHTCLHMHTCKHMHTCPHVRTHAHTHIHTRTHTHLHACMHAHTYAHTTLSLTHTHTHTHTHWAGLWQFWQWWAGMWLIWGFWVAGWLEGVLRPMPLHYAGMTWCRARSPLSAEPTGGGHCTRMWWCPHSVSEHHVHRIESRQEEKWTKKGQNHNRAVVPIRRRNKTVISIAPCLIDTALYKINKNVLIKPKK